MNVTIASGSSLSAAVDLGGARPAWILMPSSWTAANLTFQASDDGVTYANVYDDGGTELTVTAAASRAIILDLVQLVGMRYFKIRSGTAGSAVNQGADRTLVLGRLSIL